MAKNEVSPFKDLICQRLQGLNKISVPSVKTDPGHLWSFIVE